MRKIADILNDIPVIVLSSEGDKAEPELVTIAGITGRRNFIAIDRTYDDKLLVSPCDVCSRDTFYDIFVAWAALWDGDKMIVGYRLCDSCCRRALKEARERREDPGTPATLKSGDIGIVAICQLLRVNEGVVYSPEQWKEITTDPPYPEPAPEPETGPEKEGQQC